MATVEARFRLGLVYVRGRILAEGPTEVNASDGGRLRRFKEEAEARTSREQEVTKTIAELDRTLRDMATRQQLIPVCPSCRKSDLIHMSGPALNEYVQAHPETKFQDFACSTCPGT